MPSQETREGQEQGQTQTQQDTHLRINAMKIWMNMRLRAPHASVSMRNEMPRQQEGHEEAAGTFMAHCIRVRQSIYHTACVRERDETEGKDRLDITSTQAALACVARKQMRDASCLVDCRDATESPAAVAVQERQHQFKHSLPLLVVSRCITCGEKIPEITSYTCVC